jgi:hypothetical protein
MADNTEFGCTVTNHDEDYPAMEDSIFFDASRSGKYGTTAATLGKMQLSNGALSATRTIVPPGRNSYPYKMALSDGQVTDIDGYSGPASAAEKDEFKADAERYAKACAMIVAPKSP